MIQFETHCEKIYVRNINNPKILHPVSEFDECAFSQYQAEVVADTLTKVYKEGTTSALNRVRTMIDQMEINDVTKNH